MTSRYVCRFEKEMYDEWLAGVDEACSFNLNQPLISRSEESKLISVNFDPQLVAVLREVSAFFHKKSHPTGPRTCFSPFVFLQVRYLEQRQQENISESAAAIYKKKDKFRDYINNLDLTVKWYNKVRQETLEVEFPLIEGQFEEIDKQLKKALEELNWNSEGAWE